MSFSFSEPALNPLTHGKRRGLQVNYLHGPIKNPSGPMLLKLGTHKLYVVLSNIRDDDFAILIIYATLVSFYPDVLQISNVKSSKFP